jgi:ParB family chromosome partitioning protein
MSKSKLDRSSVFQSFLGDLDVNSSEVRDIPLDDIEFNANQPRRYLDDEALTDLTHSIQKHGVLEPILVRTMGERFQLVAGERRTRAAQAAGLSTIPALVKELSDDEALEISLIENLQREDLNPVEETDAILRLLGHRLNNDQDEVKELLKNLYNLSRNRVGNNVISKHKKDLIESIFARLGRFTPASFYTNRLPILSLESDILNCVREGRLDYTKAKEIAKVSDPEQRDALLQEAIDQNLSLTNIKLHRKKLSNKPARDIDKTPANLVKRVRKSLTPKRIESLPKTKQKQLEKLLSEIESLLDEN